MSHSRRKSHSSVDRRASHRRKGRGQLKSVEKRTGTKRRNESSRRNVHDRRRHIRFPVVAETLKPIEFRVFPSDHKGTYPGILTQLSPGGLGHKTFTPIQVGSSMFLTIKLPHFKINMIEGKVARVEGKGGSFMVGIHFTQINPDDRALLSRMSLDFADCELKLSFGVKDVCSPGCGFHPLCEKPYKE